MPLTGLIEKCQNCKDCALCETRTKVVVGSGSPFAKLMFVGEGPGATEDATGTPFVGRAGQLLDLYLDAFGMSRDNVYITNIVKCRPPKNRDPLPDEEAACIHFLEEQIDIIKPKVIVCLGRIAAMRLIDPNFKIMQQHGLWFKRDGYDITATLHPAALLRDPGKKPLTFEDFKIVKVALEKD